MDAPGVTTSDSLDQNAQNAPRRASHSRYCATANCFHTVWLNFAHFPKRDYGISRMRFTIPCKLSSWPELINPSPGVFLVTCEKSFSMTRTTWLGITLGIVDALLSSAQHFPLLSKAAIFEAFSRVANILMIYATGDTARRRRHRRSPARRFATAPRRRYVRLVMGNCFSE